MSQNNCSCVAARRGSAATAKCKSHRVAAPELRRSSLARGGDALKGQAGKQGPGPRWSRAQTGVRQSEASPSEEEVIGLLCARAQAAKASVSEPFAEVGEWVGNEGQIGANHVDVVTGVRRFVTFCAEESPRWSRIRNVRKIVLSDSGRNSGHGTNEDKSTIEIRSERRCFTSSEGALPGGHRQPRDGGFGPVAS